MYELLDRFCESENFVLLLLYSITMFLRYLRSIMDLERNDQGYSKLLQLSQCITQENSNQENILKEVTFSVNNKPCKRCKRKTGRKQQNVYPRVISAHPIKSHSSLYSLTDCSAQTKMKPTELPGIFSSLDINEASGHVMSQMVMPAQIKKSKNSILAAVRPENSRTEKEIFMRSQFNYNPCFVYTQDLNYKATSKFNSPSDRYISQAVLILMKVTEYFGSYEAFEEANGGHLLTRNQIFTSVKRYLKAEGLSKEIWINLCDDLLSQGSLIRLKHQTVLNVRCVKMRENCVEGLLRHEIGTHYFRSCNNRQQPWRKKRVRRRLQMGAINPTEEGLASLHSVLFRAQPFLWRPALLYYTAYMASKMSFKELFHDIGKFVKSPSVRWDYCLRAKRGQALTCQPGSFCKDQVYLDGALQLLKRRCTLDFQLLVRLGKVSYTDVDRPCITNIAKLDQTRIPWFMEDLTVYHQKLQDIASINGLTNSVLSLVE